jgi:hypothetical protein
MVSRKLVDEANKRSSAEEMLYLLTIEHPDLVALNGVVEGVTIDGKLPLVTPTRKNVTSRGQLFIAFPFQITPPEISDNIAPSLSLQIDTIDRRVTAVLLSLTDPATVLFEQVLSGSPDTVELSLSNLELRLADINASGAQCTLTQPDFGGEPTCWPPNSPATAPGIY